MLDHTSLDLLNNWVNSQRCAFQHAYGMVVVNQVRLTTRLTRGESFEFLSFLLFVDVLLIFLGLEGLGDI